MQVHTLFEGLEIEKTKNCGICRRDLPISKFGKDGGAKYLRYECKECARKQSRIVNEIKKHAPRVVENHKCHICNMTETEIREIYPNKKGIWCCDHDHKTNKFRGWLCHKCNMALGNMNDDIDRLERAIKYLKGNVE